MCKNISKHKPKLNRVERSEGEFSGSMMVAALRRRKKVYSFSGNNPVNEKPSTLFMIELLITLPLLYRRVFHPLLCRDLHVCSLPWLPNPSCNSLLILHTFVFAGELTDRFCVLGQWIVVVAT